MKQMAGWGENVFFILISGKVERSGYMKRV